MYWLFMSVSKYILTQTTIAKTLSEFSDLLEKDRIYWTSYRMTQYTR